MTAIFKTPETLRGVADRSKALLETRMPALTTVNLRYADEKQTQFMVRTYFNCLLADLQARVIHQINDGWCAVFVDIVHGEVWVRLRPVLEDDVFNVVEVRTHKSAWREFQSLADLSMVLEILDPHPF